MGYLGFLFSNDNLNKVVFIETNKLIGALIIGFESSTSILKNCELMHLNNDLSFENFLIFELDKIKYAKISLSQKTMIDFNHLTVWFNPQKYQLVRNIFEKDVADEDDLRKATLDLFDFFVK